MDFVFEGIPPEVVEVFGNFVRKFIYTQLTDIKLVGIGIGTNRGNSEYWYKINDVVDGTTTMIDVLTKLVDVDVKKGVVGELEVGELKCEPLETHTGELSEVIRSFVDIDKNIVKCNNNIIKLAFMRVKGEVPMSELNGILKDTGCIPIPVSSLKTVGINYEPDKGIFKITLPDTVAEQFKELASDFFINMGNMLKN